MLTFLWALVPSLGVLFLFWVVLRAILQADRRERAAVARHEAAVEAQTAHGSPVAPASGAADAEGSDAGKTSRA